MPRHPAMLGTPARAGMFDRLARIIPRQCPHEGRHIATVICRAGGHEPSAKVLFDCGHTGMARVTEEGAAFQMAEVPLS